MLHGVSSAGQVIGITKAANIYIYGGTSLVGIWIMNKQSLEFVQKSDNTITSVVELWSFQMVCETFCFPHLVLVVDERCCVKKTERERSGGSSVYM
jgi:hypothetical protein